VAEKAAPTYQALSRQSSSARARRSIYLSELSRPGGHQLASRTGHPADGGGAQGMGWKSHGPRSADSKYSGQLSANLPPAVAACILASPESALFLSAQNPGLSRSYALNNYDYPCQTWLPQLHVTVSVGCCLVNCFLQMGHGLVITYVMVFTPRLNHSMATADYKFIVSSGM
jgi:hypothetical protein